MISNAVTIAFDTTGAHDEVMHSKTSNSRIDVGPLIPVITLTNARRASHESF